MANWDTVLGVLKDEQLEAMVKEAEAGRNMLLTVAVRFYDSDEKPNGPDIGVQYGFNSKVWPRLIKERNRRRSAADVDKTPAMATTNA